MRTGSPFVLSNYFLITSRGAALQIGAPKLMRPGPKKPALAGPKVNGTRAFTPLNIKILTLLLYSNYHYPSSIYLITWNSFLVSVNVLVMVVLR